MTRAEILEQLNKLPTVERLALVEAVLHTLQEELGRDKELDETLATGAQTLLADYTHDAELTAFTALDAEDFRA